MNMTPQIPNPDKAELAAAFLERVLPPEGTGLYCAFLLEGKKNIFVSTQDALQRTILEQDRQGRTAYFALACFRGNARTATGAISLRALFLDIDVGAQKAVEGKGYATTAEAMQALKDFCLSNELPVPYVVLSGEGGLHVYWPLKDALPVEKWLQYAKGLKNRCSASGLRADHVVTADAARVLRLPGTFNRKNPVTPAEVNFDHGFLKIQPYELGQFDHILTTGDGAQTEGNLASPPQHLLDRRRGRGLTEAFAVGGAPWPEARCEPIAEKCAQLRRFRDTRGQISEPEWKACLGVVAWCTDGAEFGHQWSKGDARYDPVETQRKMDDTVRNTSGATTCAHFDSLNPQGCAGCSFRGRINSPIRLGEAEAVPGVATWKKVKEPAIAELNERHFVVTIGGRTLVGELALDAMGRRGALHLASVYDFKTRYGNRFVPAMDGSHDGRARALGPYWLAHRERRQYDGVDLVPGEPQDLPNGYLNLWSGWGVTPLQGDWTSMQKHILEILAAGDAEGAKYILNWAAWVVQNPAKRAEAVLAFRGGKGCGKGTFLSALSGCFGLHSIEVRNSHHLLGNFNGHLRNCLFLFADEGFWAGDKKGEAVWKGLVTEGTMMLEQKGVDAVEWPNKLSIALAGNAEWIVPASAGERRYAVFECSDRFVRGQCEDGESVTYFSKLKFEMENGGLEAMLHGLLSRDLGNWHPRQIYETAALQNQKAESLGAYDASWVEWLEEGTLPRGEHELAPIPKDFASTRVLVKDAAERAPRQRGYINDVSMGRFLKKQGCEPVRGKAESSAQRGWRFPLLSTARAAWQKRFGEWQWRHLNQTDWE